MTYDVGITETFQLSVKASRRSTIPPWGAENMPQHEAECKCTIFCYVCTMRNILAGIRIIFPVRPISRFSKKNRGATFGVLAFCMALATIKGYLHNERPDPYALIGFFDSLTGISQDIFIAVVKALYSPLGMVIWLLSVFLFFLWLAFILSGSRSYRKFREFAVPFAGLSYLALFVWLGNAILWAFSKKMPYFLQISIFLYCLIFYWQILIDEYDVNPLRAALSVLVPYLCVFPLGGFPSIAPYLLWAGG
jgi:hypothetical protein